MKQIEQALHRSRCALDSLPGEEQSTELDTGLDTNHYTYKGLLYLNFRGRQNAAEKSTQGEFCLNMYFVPEYAINDRFVLGKVILN